MKFLIDNALSPRFSGGLIKLGYESVHVRDIGLSSALDEVIFDYAVRENRILISEDTDFGTILAARNSIKPSFILFKMEDKRTYNLLDILINNLPDIKDALEQGSVVVFEDQRIRIRKLPFRE
ncbi:MAG: DUF5615 family PIN-like protein [Candidatus Schekmanbacteria bacterium]|nr:DUF5615 family PIN-like protein [Candidatus Schekmanbacteria bacterium]